MITRLSEQDVLKLLHRRIAQAGSMAAFSRESGIPKSNLSEMVNGSRGPSPALLKALGLEKIIVYRTEEKNKNKRG